jgi:hypothetical protein
VSLERGVSRAYSSFSFANYAGSPLSSDEVIGLDPECFEPRGIILQRFFENGFTIEAPVSSMVRTGISYCQSFRMGMSHQSTVALDVRSKVFQ